MELVVTGLVEKFADIRPERVKLVGPAGRPVFVDVEIIPRKNFPFTVIDITAGDGEFIKYEFKKRCSGGKGRCVVRVENTMSEKGVYADTLYVRTDSTLKPVIPIRITGMIQ